jgi:hypothetical protein
LLAPFFGLCNFGFFPLLLPGVGGHDFDDADLVIKVDVDRVFDFGKAVEGVVEAVEFLEETEEVCFTVFGVQFDDVLDAIEDGEVLGGLALTSACGRRG